MLPQTRRLHTIFKVQDIHDQILWSDDFQIHLIELPKLRHGIIEATDACVVKWAQFFTATTEQERRRAAMGNGGIKTAHEALQELSQDPETRRIARWREDQLMLEHLARENLIKIAVDAEKGKNPTG